MTPQERVKRARRMLDDMVRAARVRDRLLPAHADMHRINADSVCRCQRMMGGER